MSKYKFQDVDAGDLIRKYKGAIQTESAITSLPKNEYMKKMQDLCIKDCWEIREELSRRLSDAEALQIVEDINGENMELHMALTTNGDGWSCFDEQGDTIHMYHGATPEKAAQAAFDAMIRGVLDDLPFQDGGSEV